MIAMLVAILLGATLLGTAINAGFYFAFSFVVMPALHRTTPAEGIQTMQRINQDAVRPPFMITFFGTALAAIAMIVSALVQSDQPQLAWIVAGGVLSLVGFLSTIGYNVPRNGRLDQLDPDGAESVAHWQLFQKEWTTANHFRMVASVLGALTLIVAAMRLT